MRLYERLFRPLLFRRDAEATHEQMLAALAWAQSNRFGRLILRAMRGSVPEQKPVSAFGLRFPNVLGVAAGFDKEARIASGLAELGFGHVEVGTLTPRPQAGNPRPRIFRLPEDRALINRMGFPNEGVAAAVPRLRALSQRPRQFVVGVSLGKQKETPLDDAAADYLEVLQRVHPFADYLAINVSSPNTPGLRRLQGEQYLDELLSSLKAEAIRLSTENNLPQRPILLKIAPDLTPGELQPILDAALRHAIDGLIATNTTLAREGLRSPKREEAGGLSGRPLTEPSTALIAHLVGETGGALPVIGVGGVFSADDVRAKLDAGARLVQIYTGLVYAGPGLAGRLLRNLGAAA